MADVEAPPPQVEVQDPLPENNWFWRRVFVFTICSAVFIGAWIEITTMVALAGDNPELIVGAFIQIIKWEFIIAWCAMTYYLIAPSAEQLGKWMATVNAWKAGIATSTVSTATGADGSVAQATTVSGPAPTVAAATAPVVAPSSESGLPANPTVAYEGPEAPDPSTVSPITSEEPKWPK
jgi:hypothetical protein